jgi:hypothetical protein
MAFDEPERFPLAKEATHKEALIQKLSEIEKRIEGQISGKLDSVKDDAKAISQDKDLPDEVVSKLGKEEPGDATKALADKGIMLKLPEFIKMLMGGAAPEGLDSAADQVPGSFSRGTCPRDSTKFDEPTGMSGIQNLLSDFMGERSLFKLPAARRSITIIISGGGKPELKSPVDMKEKIASETTLPKQVLEAYNSYRLAACDHVLRTKHAADAESFLRLSVLQGYLK